MKSLRSFIFLLASFMLISFVSAQDFRGVKWGMSRKQIQSMEKEGVITQPLDSNDLAYKIMGFDKSVCSSLDVHYEFSNTDSLISISLLYDNATRKFYNSEIVVNNSKCGKPIKIGTTLWWRSKDSSYVIALFEPYQSYNFKITNVTIVPHVDDIDFSKKSKEQSDLHDWQTVQTFTGTSIQTTDDFSIESKKWRIVWDVSLLDDSTHALMFIAELVDSKEHSELFANVSNENHGESIFRKGGKYYLKINTVNAKWSIEIQEYK